MHHTTIPVRHVTGFIRSGIGVSDSLTSRKRVALPSSLSELDVAPDQRIVSTRL